MGVIYINGGYKKAKQPISLDQTNINIGGCDQNLDIYVGEDGNMIVSSESSSDNTVQDEILNIV